MRSKLKLTASAVDRLPFATSGQELHRFDDPPGLLLLVGKATKTFAMQSDRSGDSRRVTLGRWPGMKVEAARARALELLAGIERGRGLQPAAHTTLRQAVTAYLSDRKTLAPRTREYTNTLLEHLEDWADKPLASITPTMILDRHRKIGSTRPTTANDVMRKLRVVYNHATATDDALPANPVRKLSGARAWYPTQRKTDHIAPDQLAHWLFAVLDVRGLYPVHADLVALITLTGMRREEASALRWEECDVDAGTITLSASRTKQRREHIVYLSAQAADVLLLRGPKKSGWVFPASSATGHVSEPRWPLDMINAIAGTECSVHGLRRTFISIAETCAISPMQLSSLVGHAAGNITQSYVQHDAGVIRAAAQLVGTRIEEIWFANAA